MAKDKEPAHQWVGATNTELTDRQARLALLRGAIALPERHKMQVLEVYCSDCMRPYEDVVGEQCSAKVNNEHLRGGPIGVRKKRGTNARMAAAPAQQAG